MKGVCFLGLVSLVVALAQEIAQDDITNEKPIVKTHFGKIQGDINTSRDGRMYYQFKGINYAKVSGMFEPSEIPDHWGEEIKDGTKFGPVCPQYDPMIKEFVGEEQCLNLNVYTTKMPKEGEHKVLLPVVVFLHPGGHNHGSGSHFQAKYLMDEEVVVVTLNSRLGPFGFLNVGDMYASGNQGLKDQVLALRWVQNNIENFSGDKSRITLMGSSTGGSEVLLQILNPLSKGMFHGAIVQSGSPISYSFIRDPIHQAKKLAEQVGCPKDEGSKSFVECLKGMKPLDILKKMTMMNVAEFNQDDIAMFGPSIEHIMEDQTENDIVLSDSPYKLLTSGKLSNKVPIIQGFNNLDGLIKYTLELLNNTEALAKLNENWDKLAPKMLYFAKTAKDPQAVAQRLRAFYFGGKQIGPDTTQELINIFTDRYFASFARFSTKNYNKYAPMYLYYFTHTPKVSLKTFLGYTDIKLPGATHLDELQYIFNFPDNMSMPEITKDGDKNELILSQGMVKLWSSFIENGKPTKTWGEGKEWKKVENPEKPQWYKIDLETKTIDEPEEFTKRADLWSDIYRNHLAAELMTPPVEEKF